MGGLHFQKTAFARHVADSILPYLAKLGHTQEFILINCVELENVENTTYQTAFRVDTAVNELSSSERYSVGFDQ